MKHTIKQLLLANAPLKIVSLIAGYLLWVMLASFVPITVTVDAPVCAYGLAHHAEVTLPDSVALTLYGSRADLQALNIQELAVHIDATHLPCGNHELPLAATHLFLPKNVELVDCCPSRITIALS